MNDSVPWVEKYRPSEFNNIVLDQVNKKILQNILDTSYFPNLLFYGPPGTGKTTSIINLLSAYQDKHNQRHRGLIIHLNASDDRGIETIRNQISQFVNSKGLFNKGMKFVILDEVDYMTKNAQQALRYLLQSYAPHVRFCLICNYISRIDESIQNEFLRLRFNQLPENGIQEFLTNIATMEGLAIGPEAIRLIQKFYKSDIRSMINFMQANQNITEASFRILSDDALEELHMCMLKLSADKAVALLQQMSSFFRVDKNTIIKCYVNYVIRSKTNIVTRDLLDVVEKIMHFQDCRKSYYIMFSITEILKCYTCLPVINTHPI